MTASPRSPCSTAATGPASRRSAPPPSAAATPGTRGPAASRPAPAAPGCAAAAATTTLPARRCSRCRPTPTSAARSGPAAGRAPAGPRPGPGCRPTAPRPTAAVRAYRRGCAACGRSPSCPRRSRAAPLFRRLDRLAVQHGGRRLAVPAEGGPHVAAQQLQQSVEGAVALPLHEVPVDDPPGREVRGQHPPPAAGAGDVQQAIDDLAPRVLGGPAAGPGGGDDPLELGPLAVGQVGRVAVPGVHDPH